MVAEGYRLYRGQRLEGCLSDFWRTCALGKSLALISILPSSVNCRRRSFRSTMLSNRVHCR
jgi:hypothetical protein